MFEDLTWTCHVCRKERPNKFISVHKNPVMIGTIFTHENIRYCNDNPDCIEGVKNFSFTERK